MKKLLGLMMKRIYQSNLTPLIPTTLIPIFLVLIFSFFFPATLFAADTFDNSVATNPVAPPAETAPTLAGEDVADENRARENTADENISGGHIYTLSGNVFITHGKNSKRQVTKTSRVFSDTMVHTEDKSAAVIKFDDGQAVTLKANSTFHIQNYHYQPKQIAKSNILFSMLAGGMRFVTGLIGQSHKQGFRLTTPIATIGIRGTEFMTSMVGDSVYSQVLTGNIDLTNAAGTTLLDAGQTAVTASTNTLATLISAANIPPAAFEELLSIPLEPPSTSPTQPTASEPASISADAATAPIDAATSAGAAVGGIGIPAAGAVGGIISATTGLLGGGDTTEADSAKPASEPAQTEKIAEPAIEKESTKKPKKLSKAEKKKLKKDKKAAKKAQRKKEELENSKKSDFFQ